MAKPVEIARVDQTSTRTGNGPRSKAGKERASRNAIKHGIFSEVVLLPGEPGEKYQSLLKELHDALQPEGRLEELLVEKLGMLAWRHRRLLTAEGAEIRQGTESVKWDRENRERKRGRSGVDLASIVRRGDGLIQSIHIPEIFDHCLELLRELQEEIDCTGLNREHDSEVLKIIYGSEPSLKKTLLGNYLMWVDTAEAPDEERRREGYSTPQQCKKNILVEIEREIRGLRGYGRNRASVESERGELEVLLRAVPQAGKLDRFLRYEASLERSFDRTLNQLERVQRLRRGQPAAPRIDVTVSR